MMILVTYDVNTQDPSGRKRLSQVAKKCVAYGQRVQNSVFECNLDAAQYKTLVFELKKIIDSDKDTIRFYELGNGYKKKIVKLGIDSSYDAQDLILV